MKLLITGATGNVGIELIRSLTNKPIKNIEIFAGVRNIKNAKKKILKENVDFRTFDFENKTSFSKALTNIDVLFLLRPPQIANVKKYFEPLIEIAEKQKVKHIIFLSVQGADKIKFIPHHKIENLIIKSKINYTFIRPSYFMQNLSTTLEEDLAKDLIYLPAKDAQFNFIDILDIADFCAKIIIDFPNYKNEAYTLTGKNNYSFSDVKDLLNKIANKNVVYRSPTPVVFLLCQIFKGKSFSQSLVILMLHFLKRFQNTPEISDDFENIMKKSPRNLGDFIKRTYTIENAR